MNLLSSIKAKKSLLKNTTTVVTTLDGRRFKQINNQTSEIDGSTYGFVVDTKPDDIPSQITDHIYLGSQDCCDEKVLKQHNITHILSVGIDPPNCQQFIEGVQKFVPCLDLPETDIETILLNDCVPFLTEVIKSDGKVLVHCNAGVSRSATVVIGFLILQYDLNYEEAFQTVHKARSCIKPNAGFQNQLKNIKPKK